MPRRRERPPDEPAPARLAAVPVTREVGRRVVASFKRSLAERFAESWRSDPERLARAVELGIINPEWVEEPGEHEFSSAAPLEVVERFLERTAEQRPSVLASLGLTALQVLAAESETSGEGSTAVTTVMFTDLERFTAYNAAEGDVAASALLVAHHKTVGPIVRARGGRIVKRLGDGLLLTFPVPEAAVLAGVELVEHSPAPLRLRVGAHHGEVMVSRDDVVGHVVNVAARVADRAKGGEVLVTAQVRDAAIDAPGVTFQRARRLRVKGVDEQLAVCTVTRTGGMSVR